MVITKPEQSALQLLQHDATGLAHLFIKAKRLLRYSRYLAACLPTAFIAHCRVVNLEGPILTLGTESASIATRLRFEAATLLTALRQQHADCQHITQLRCRVIPDLFAKQQAPRAHPPRPPCRLSAQSRTLLLDVAEQYTGTPLGDILTRIVAWHRAQP